MFLRYGGDGDPAARAELIERYLPLARKLARRYEWRGEPLDDLVQVATLGLVKALDRFEPGRGVKFSDYAIPTILGTLKRHFRDHGWAVHMPRGLQESVLNANAAVERMGGELGRSPSPQEVAEELNLPVENVLDSILAGAAYQAAPLDGSVSGGDDQNSTLTQRLGEPDERFELIEAWVSIAGVFETLPERERLILHLRFVEDLTQSEIGQRIGVSQMQVSRLIRKALERVRAAAGVA